MLKVKFHPQEADLFNEVPEQDVTVSEKHNRIEIETGGGLTLIVKEYSDHELEVMWNTELGSVSLAPTASNVFLFRYYPKGAA